MKPTHIDEGVPDLVLIVVLDGVGIRVGTLVGTSDHRCSTGATYSSLGM